MISRVTLYSLLLCLLLGLGLRKWSMAHPDSCDRYLAGERKLPASEYVISGSRQIVVPCNQWLIRQPEWMQILCLVDLLLAGVFAVNAAGDMREWLRTRRSRAGGFS